MSYNKSERAKMEDIYTKCLKHYADVTKFDWVVQNSIPIPFFGDLAAYNNSEKRVLTVALNPSDKEFPKEGDPRFKVEQALRGPEELEAELSAYFKRNPYSK